MRTYASVIAVGVLCLAWSERALPGAPSPSGSTEVASLKALVKECDTRLERLAQDAARLRDDIADAERGMRYSSAAAFRATLKECEREMANWRDLRAKTLRRIAELER